jgi:hypothetical protein
VLPILAGLQTGKRNVKKNPSSAIEVENQKYKSNFSFFPLTLITDMEKTV